MHCFGFSVASHNCVAPVYPRPALSVRVGPVLTEVGPVLKGLLAAHVEERKASAADMMAVRRALVVILANIA